MHLTIQLRRRSQHPHQLLLVAFYVGLLCLFTFPQTSFAQPCQSDFLLKFGSAGAGPGQFNLPFGVAVDTNGNIFVVDNANNRVQKFTSAGVFVTQWDGTGSLFLFNDPRGIAVDPAGNVYVGDFGNDRIVKFNNNGGFLLEWGGNGVGNGLFSGPEGVAVDATGTNVYVADVGNDLIQKFSNTGTFVTQWGGNGGGNGLFTAPRGVAVDAANNVYVADTGNDLIQKFSNTGTFLLEWGGNGNTNGLFSGPVGIATDNMNNVYVADTQNDRIQKFTSTGAHVMSFGTTGINNGEFDKPRGVTLDAAKNIYVADTNNNRIQKFGCPPFPAPPLNVKIGDPALCLEPGGLVGVAADVTNPNNAPQPASFSATLPTGLTTVAGSCMADVPGACTLTNNTVSWNGTLAAGQRVTITYRARIASTVAAGATLCLANTGTVAGVAANLQACVTINCPAIVNTRVSGQKAGSVLVFPYYTSTLGGASDTRLTISNISNAASTVANQTYVHLFLIDGTSCQQSDLFLCLTPNASFSFKASDYDPGNTGYVIAVAVNNQGVPIQSNVLIGNAFVNTPQFADNYSAESFAANSAAVATVSGNAATLYFDQIGYDAVPKQFAVEIQSPVDLIGQQIVTAGLNGDLTTSTMSGATQVGTGQAFNEKESFVSFTGWLTGTCQARATIATNSPRVPNGLNNLIKTGQAGTLKFNVGSAVGLLLTPRTATWRGIRALHKTQTTATTLTIPIFAPVC